MSSLSYLKDRDFLRALDNENNKFYWVKIEVLNMKELPIQSIEGKVQPGSSISIDGSSSVRRTCTINFIAEDKENNLTNIDSLLSANKKIKIYEGIENHISIDYNDIIWFPLGIFVITQPNISHTSNGCLINLSCKDKMCLLNGECGGALPASVTFHEYDQMIGERACAEDPANLKDLEPNNYTIYSYPSGNEIKYKSWTREYGWKEEKDNSSVGELVHVPQLMYDIVQTLVCNFGGEALERIFINDLPLEIKQIVRYVGSSTLYYNTKTSQYTTDEAYLDEAYLNEKKGVWRSFKFNEDVGYVYTDFVYPGELISNIGDNICTILDKIKNALGNFEYFYDVNGNFVFQEIKNYLNNSYNPNDIFRLDNNRKVDALAENGLAIINESNYRVDFNSNTRSVYTFNEGNGLITSYSNAPSYMNLKNDYHIWGKKDDGFAIHYHIAIKKKPFPVVYKKSIPTPAQQEAGYNSQVDYDQFELHNVVFLKNAEGEYNGKLRLAAPSDKQEEIVSYIPIDWRAELYIQGLIKQANQIRPNIYEQELLDLFDAIYNFKEKKFKADLVLNPNELSYFFDYLEPVSNLYDCSVDALDTKIYSYQQDKLIRLYDIEIPNVIMIDLAMDPSSRAKIIERCEREGQPYTNVESNIYAKIAIGTVGYSAQEVCRELLYQYTNYNESISIQSIPIYYLDVNSRITVFDKQSNIYGDYIIKSLSVPLDAGATMSITATRALERI